MMDVQGAVITVPLVMVAVQIIKVSLGDWLDSRFYPLLAVLFGIIGSAMNSSADIVTLEMLVFGLMAGGAAAGMYDLSTAALPDATVPADQSLSEPVSGHDDALS